MIACFSGVLEILWKEDLLDTWVLLLMVLLLALGRLIAALSPRALKLLIRTPMCRAASVWSPLVAIVLLALSIKESNDHSMIEWAVFLVLLVAVLVATISNLRFTRISKVVDSVLGSKQEFWRHVVINVCMIAVLCMLGFMLDGMMLTIQLCALLVVSFGNFQIPAAVVRVILALDGLLDDSESAAYNESVDGQKKH